MPGHAKMYLRASVDSKGPDQPAHPHSLIRAFAVCSQDNGILINASVEAKCPYETLCICMM